jgi:hypothetical protein
MGDIHQQLHEEFINSPEYLQYLYEFDSYISLKK